MIYVETTKEFAKNNPLEVMNKFSKVAGDKVNTKSGCISIH